SVSAFSGSSTHFQANSKSSAVTGSPLLQVASSLILKVYVNPSSEISIDSAIASSGSPSRFIRVNPSNTWSSTALDVVSEDVPGCKDGGSLLILMFRDWSAASCSSAGSSPLVSLTSESSLPPQATKTILSANTSVRESKNFLQFIINDLLFF